MTRDSSSPEKLCLKTLNNDDFVFLPAVSTGESISDSVPVLTSAPNGSVGGTPAAAAVVAPQPPAAAADESVAAALKDIKMAIQVHSIFVEYSGLQFNLIVLTSI